MGTHFGKLHTKVGASGGWWSTEPAKKKEKKKKKKNNPYGKYKQKTKMKLIWI